MYLSGNEVLIYLKAIKVPDLSLMKRFGVIDSLIKVHCIPSMEENRFIISVYELIDFDDDEDYEIYYNRSKSDKIYFKNMDAMIVGDIVDCESSN